MKGIIRMAATVGLMSLTFQASAAWWGTLREEPGDGVPSQWVRKSVSYMNIGGMAVAEQWDLGGALTIVTSDNGTVWIDYPISSFRTNGWLEGNIVGDEMTFSLPQCILEDEGTPFYLAVVSKSGIMADDQSYTFKKVGDSWVSKDTKACLGIVNSTGDWMYCSDYDYTLSPFDSVGEEAPSGLATETYAFRAGESGHYVKIGFDGNDCWIKGLLETSPDNWLRGTLKDNKVTFESGAYLGTYDSYAVTPHHVYFMACDLQDNNYEGIDSLDFIYDASTGKMSTSGSFVFNFSSIPEDLCFIESADEPTFTKSENGGGAMTPAMPTNVILTDDSESVIALIPQISDNDELLDADKLFYIVYIGDEPLTFTRPTYEYLDMEEMTEVPYNYTENYDFIINGTYHEVYLYGVGDNVVGVQTVYYGGGERRVSDILYSNGDIVESGVSVVKSEDGHSDKRYDLSGRKVSENYRGITISRDGRKEIVR